MRDSFVFYRSFAEACRELPAEDFKAAVLAMCDYAMDDIECGENGVAKAIYIMAKPVIDANNTRFENGKKGGRPKTNEEPNNNQTETEPKPKHNQAITETEPYVDVDEDVYVNIKEKDTPKGVSKEKAPKRFSPPPVEEVREYCEERKNNVDPEQFVDFYTSKGWYVGNKPMKDWKAAVRTWEKRREYDQAKARSGTTNKFKNFEERAVNLDDLMDAYERQKFGVGG